MMGDNMLSKLKKTLMSITHMIAVHRVDNMNGNNSQ
jgi:hypothetical protein